MTSNDMRWQHPQPGHHNLDSTTTTTKPPPPPPPQRHQEQQQNEQPPLSDRNSSKCDCDTTHDPHSTCTSTPMWMRVMVMMMMMMVMVMMVMTGTQRTIAIARLKKGNSSEVQQYPTIELLQTELSERQPCYWWSQKDRLPGWIQVISLQVVSHKAQLFHSFFTYGFSFLTLVNPRFSQTWVLPDNGHESKDSLNSEQTNLFSQNFTDMMDVQVGHMLWTRLTRLSRTDCTKKGSGNHNI